MLKEAIICIIIVIAIIFGNTTTQNYTKETVGVLSSKLMNLREDISQKEIEHDKVQNEIEEIYKQWEERHEKLAYYIEHTELEKVETELIEIKSLIETENYEEVISKLDKGSFELKHIEDMYAFNLQNIF